MTSLWDPTMKYIHIEIDVTFRIQFSLRAYNKTSMCSKLINTERLSQVPILNLKNNSYIRALAYRVYYQYKAVGKA